MAALTDSLPLAGSSRRIIDPGDGGPSWLEGIASGAAKAVTAIGNKMDESEATRQRTAAAEAKAREEASKNAAAGLALDHALGRGEFAPPAPHAQVDTPVSAMPALISGIENMEQSTPVDVMNSVNEATRARSAEQQGRAPNGSSRIILERSIARMEAEYPDLKHVWLEEFRKNGFDHYLMRERDTEEALYDAEVAGTIKQQADYAAAATAAGAIMPGTDMQTAAAVGQRIARQEYMLKLDKEERASEQAAAAEGRTAATYQREEAEREITKNFQAGMSAALFPSINGITNLFTQSNGDQTVMELIPETLNALDLAANNWITAAQQNGAPQETVDAMRKTWADSRVHIVDLVNGPGSELGVATSILKGMETQLGINTMQALPVMYAMKELFGLDGLERAMGDNPAVMMPQETKDAIKREINGISGAIDTNPERVGIATIAQLLRGQLQISELTEREAQIQMPNMVNAVRGHMGAITQGGGNVEAYVNANLAVANAAMELQGGNSNATTEAVVTNNAFDRAARDADLALAGRDPESAAILIEGKRGAAMHMLQNINNNSWRDHPTDTQGGLWNVAYNPTNATVNVEIRQADYDRWAARQRVATPGQPHYMGGGNSTTVPTREEMLRRGPPKGLTDRVGSINLLSSYLVATNPYDDTFQGVSAHDARRFYMTGVVPAEIRERNAAQAEERVGLADQIEQYRRGLDQTRTDSMQLAANEIGARAVENTPPAEGELQTTVKAMAENVGVGWDTVNRLVRKESRWNINADSGSSQGLFQVNAPNAGSMTWQENAEEGLKRWVAAGENAQRVLGRAPTDADQYVAYQQGPGGGVALLDPANASKNAVEVLRPLYRDLATARSAVVGNGGNVNMTAAQFAQHIRDYFNK